MTIKLSPDEVREIYRLTHTNKDLSYCAIGRMYNVCGVTIRDIKYGDVWGSVTSELRYIVTENQEIEDTTEEWRPVKGYPQYSVSNKGRVKSFKHEKREGKLMKPAPNELGYLHVNLFSNGTFKKYKRFKVHRLVGMAFIPNSDNLPYINHKNGIVDDNRVENLEWCTHSQNMKHAFNVLHPNAFKGENCRGHRVLSNEDVKSIHKLSHSSELTHEEIGDMYGVDKTTVWCIHSGKTWNHVTNQLYERKPHGRAIFTEEQVLDIYHLAWNSNLTMPEIGKKYNTCAQTISTIKHGYSWNSVTHHKDRLNKIAQADNYYCTVDAWL